VIHGIIKLALRMKESFSELKKESVATSESQEKVEIESSQSQTGVISSTSASTSERQNLQAKIQEDWDQPKICHFTDCTNPTVKSNTKYCELHSSGNRRCKYPGCSKSARDKFFCASHGGGKVMFQVVLTSFSS
jgi:hypothetical protein